MKKCEKKLVLFLRQNAANFFVELKYILSKNKQNNNSEIFKQIPN